MSEIGIQMGNDSDRGGGPNSWKEARQAIRRRKKTVNKRNIQIGQLKKERDELRELAGELLRALDDTLETHNDGSYENLISKSERTLGKQK